MVQLSDPRSDVTLQWNVRGGFSTGWESLSGTVDGDYIWHGTVATAGTLISSGNSTAVKKPIAGGPILFRFKHQTKRPGFSGALWLAQMGSTADGIVAQKNMTSNNTSWLTTTYVLTALERAAITDWANLAWRFVYQSGTAEEIRVTLHQIEMPDPAGGANRWWSGWRHG